MQKFYSLLGKPATRFPSCLLRSYLLSIALEESSITGWCRQPLCMPYSAVFPLMTLLALELFTIFLTGYGNLTKIITLIR